ncbi:MAG: hypothetical protein NZN28_07700 [Meiothermus sp.]|uniref:hypothetical protein n=1 Tax=Meiothermus sp. TaxID=1955249 RepID=UPI0025DEE1D4|nr:hypothetical protein [Meiothermus sp.]MCS7068498.1 hypothetical protein [Meiothermus sp.]
MSVHSGDKDVRPGEGALALLEDERAGLTARLLEAGAALGWSPQTLKAWQQWAHAASLEALQGAVNSAEGRLQRRREAAREGLPIAWRSVPEVPRGGEKTPLVDEKGYGALYRLEHAGVWYLVKFLPPFDGRVSLTAHDGPTRVFAGLEEALRFLGQG